MDGRSRITLVFFAVSALAYFPFSQWISTTRIGTTIFLWGQLFYALAMLAALVASPVLVVRLFSGRERRATVFYLFVCFLLIACGVGGVRLGQRTRRAGMRSFTDRSQELISAIDAFEREHSAPPKSLDQLVPDYLPIVPSTGMMAYPEYTYRTGDDAAEYYLGNPWALTVSTPSGGINFDMLLYLPNGNYPKHGFGGWLEPIGDWAYVHE
jgi:hypothetical protein